MEKNVLEVIWEVRRNYKNNPEDWSRQGLLEDVVCTACDKYGYEVEDVEKMLKFNPPTKKAFEHLVAEMEQFVKYQDAEEWI